MTAADHRRAAAFLRRIGLLAGVLAIIAGIFGMHVMTGNHTMHPSLSAAADGTVHEESAAAAGHTGHQAASGPAADRAEAYGKGVVAPADSCSCSGDCTGMQAMTASCVPSAKSASMAAPLPGTAGFAVNVNAGVGDATAVRWSYLPGSPSPGELSISRT